MDGWRNMPIAKVHQNIAFNGVLNVYIAKWSNEKNVYFNEIAFLMINILEATLTEFIYLELMRRLSASHMCDL